MARLETAPYHEFDDVNKLAPHYIQKIRRTLRSRLRSLVKQCHHGGNIHEKVERLKRDIKRLSDANVRQNRI